MNDLVYCNVCRKAGSRTWGKHCPLGWLYGEGQDTSRDDGSPLVLWVCSKECSERFWLVGPGDLRTSPPYIVDANTIPGVDG